MYIIFLGIILTITTGYGIAAFYPEEKMPSYPQAKPYIASPKSCFDTPESQQSIECKKYLEEDKQRQTEDQAAQQEYQRKLDEYENRNASYTRTTVFLGIAVGTFFAILALAVLKISFLVSNGLLLAAVLTAVLTRILVGLASLGNRVTGTQGADQMAYIQFGILVLLSFAIVFVGMFTLKEAPSKK